MSADNIEPDSLSLVQSCRASDGFVALCGSDQGSVKKEMCYLRGGVSTWIK